jgi:hypothetical protein
LDAPVGLPGDELRGAVVPALIDRSIPFVACFLTTFVVEVDHPPDPLPEVLLFIVEGDCLRPILILPIVIIRRELAASDVGVSPLKRT